MSKNLDLITIKSFNISKVIDTIDQYGCCVIKNYLNKKELNDLKSEFDYMFLDSKENNTFIINSHPTNKKGVYIICKKKAVVKFYVHTVLNRHNCYSSRCFFCPINEINTTLCTYLI